MNDQREVKDELELIAARFEASSWFSSAARVRRGIDEIDRLRARVAELELILAGRKPLIEGDAPSADPARRAVASYDSLGDELELVQTDHASEWIAVFDPSDGATYTKDYPYRIRFSRLQSVCGFLDWMKHLGEKEWFTGLHARVFTMRYETLVRNGILPSRFYEEVNP